MSHGKHSMNQHEYHMHDSSDESEHSHTNHSHHEMMVKDFRKRFWISFVITIPILLLSPMIKTFLHLENAVSFKGDLYVLFALSTIVFFYGGWPFLKGIVTELHKLNPGMMTLIRHVLH